MRIAGLRWQEGAGCGCVIRCRCGSLGLRLSSLRPGRQPASWRRQRHGVGDLEAHAVLRRRHSRWHGAQGVAPRRSRSCGRPSAAGAGHGHPGRRRHRLRPLRAAAGGHARLHPPGPRACVSVLCQLQHVVLSPSFPLLSYRSGLSSFQLPVVFQVCGVCGCGVYVLRCHGFQARRGESSLLLVQ
eukprot:8778965-Alexandrium_andersonii.AAC.1